MTSGGQAPGADARSDISSLIDTWLLLRDIESGGERNRGLYVLKSRGMAHSNQIREFRLTDHGVELLDVYLGPGGVLTGSARLAQEARERAEETLREQEIERKQAQVEAERKALEAQIAALQAKLTAAEQEMKLAAAQERDAGQRTGRGRARAAMAQEPAGRCDGRESRHGVRDSEPQGEHRMTKPEPNEPPASEKWELRLYVAGQTPKSRHGLRQPQEDSARSTWPGSTASR